MARKEREIRMSKNIFTSFILLVSILFYFTGNVCSFIHPVGEREFEILVSLVAGTFLKRRDWNSNEHVDIKTTYSLANTNKTVAALIHI